MTENTFDIRLGHRFVVSLVCAALVLTPVQLTRSVVASEVTEKPVLEPVRVDIPDAVSVDPHWYTWHATMTPDGKTMYFMSTAGPRLEVIMESHFTKGKWSTPEVAPFSGIYWMESPSVSPDGRRFFFDKPRGQLADIWVMDKTADGWSEPRDLGAPINTERFFQASASAAANGNLYFFSNRDGGFKIYCARWVQGAYQEPEKLSDAVNAPDAMQPAIAPDESFLVFSSNRPGGLGGGGDLYVSFRENGVWTPARNLGPKINSRAWDGRPYVTADGKYLLFTSTRDFGHRRLEKRVSYSELLELLKGPLNGRTNIYQVDVAALRADAR